MIRRGRTLLITGILFFLTVVPARAQETSVRSILFFSPADDDSKTFLNSVLPALLVEHGRDLVLLTIDVTQPEGGQLYQSALAALDIPPEDRILPLLAVGDTYLSGLDVISDHLPGLIEEELSAGGTDWPPIPGLEDILQKAGFSKPPSTPWEKFLNDQPSNTLAVIVLAGLFLSLLFSILFAFRPAPKFLSSIPSWAFPVLLVVGFAAASYLTYTETTRSDVFCGGVSHCTDVQDSPYSKIFGLINVGEFGLLGYALIGASWLVHRYGGGNAKAAAAIAMYGFAVFGVSFSTYLTFLEPFVIGATCLWCLTSAVVMGLILPLTILPVHEVMSPHAAGKPNRPAGG
jgi:uncharacterized membrane protein